MRNTVFIDLYHTNCTDTDYTECRIAYWLWRTVPFTLLTIGLMGNILNFVVLSRQRMRKYSTTVYLLFLAGSDMAFLLSGVLPDTVYGITGFRLTDYSIFFCKIRWWTVYTSAAFSVWLLVLLTVERLLLTKAPFAARSRLTPMTSFVASMSILVLLAAANIHTIIGFKHYSSEDELKAEFGVKLLKLNFPCNYASRKYMSFFTGIYQPLMLIAYNVIPALIILTGNVNIGVAILIQKRRLNKVHPSSRMPSETNRSTRFELSTVKKIKDFRLLSTQTKRLQTDQQTTVTVVSSACITDQSDPNGTNQAGTSASEHNTRPTPNANRTIKTSNSPARMLFTLTIFFIVTTFPFCLYFVLQGRLGELNDKDIAKWKLITVALLCLAWCNYSFNFFLYFVSGTLFKKEWKRILQKGKEKISSIFG